MVKRAIAIALGAVAGVLLWHVVEWIRTPVEADADPVSVENCLRGALVDCAEFEAPLAPIPAPEPIAGPCKDWLTGEADAAALSQCLMEARRSRDAVRIQNYERAQRIAASS
jgi:hypothetical protein